jgi:hypothetical protein
MCVCTKESNFDANSKTLEHDGPQYDREEKEIIKCSFCMTAHRSVHKGGTCTGGVDCSPSSSVQSRYSALLLPTLWAPEGCTSRTPFCKRRPAKHSVPEELRRFSKEFYATCIQRLTRRWKMC